MRQEGIQRLNELAIEIKNLRKSNSLRSKCEENYRKNNPTTILLIVIQILMRECLSNHNHNKQT